MNWIASLVLNFITFITTLVISHALCPLIKFCAWYLLYTLGAIILKVVLKLRYEVFNEDLKYKRAECNNRLVLVTGATSGIGLAAARYFHSRGFAVVACFYSRDEPGYHELNNLSIGTPSRPNEGALHLVELDVKSNESIRECYKQVRSLLGDNPKLKLHALLNVAGVGYFHKFQWTPRDLIRNMVETNLLGPMLMTRQFLHLLIECPGSRVVNVASPMGFIPAGYNSVYGATKAGLTQFSNALELELLRYGVKTSTIHPGNLIRNTAVLNSSFSAKLDKILPELNEEERQLYKSELDKHLDKMNRVERALRRPVNIKLSSKSTLSSNLVKLGLIASGSVQETRLNDSESFMQSFDNAIRLKDPPKEMCAGNCFFNLVAGSAIEWMSRALFRDLCLVLQRNKFGVLL